MDEEDEGEGLVIEEEDEEVAHQLNGKNRFSPDEEERKAAHQLATAGNRFSPDEEEREAAHQLAAGNRFSTDEEEHTENYTTEVSWQSRYKGVFLKQCRSGSDRIKF